MKIGLKEAVLRLKRGEVIAMPTETVYGLAAPIRDVRAVKRVFALKGRPSDNPLIVHVATLKQARSLVTALPKNFSRLMRFWPGPLTVVLPADLKVVPQIVRAGLKTVAVRMPDHKVALALIRKIGPLAAPSANVSGRPSPTRRAHVEADLGKGFPVLDGGACRRGVESTVISLREDGWSILRAGAVSAEEIAKVLKMPEVAFRSSKRPRAPGQKYRHYAPAAKLTLCESHAEFAKKASRHDAVLGFSDTHTGLPLVSLGKRNQPKENLRRLYAALRSLDERKYRRVLVDFDFAKKGLGTTLAERLLKASL